jgi:2-polyprenyl-3-methyl-5-hydroxy-6-metoxy-1,4-benzoquinol methylase
LALPIAKAFLPSTLFPFPLPHLSLIGSWVEQLRVKTKILRGHVLLEAIKVINMKQTPVHDSYNPDLLSLIPLKTSALIDVGCGSGGLVREFKKLNPSAHCVGVDIDPKYVELAERYCDRCMTLDIDNAAESFWQSVGDRDCWIFGDALEHFKDPWAVLRKVRSILPEHGCVVACLPNAQHWSLQAKLNVGEFRYQDSGLLDRTHLRWFTRKTMIELFQQTGFVVKTGKPRIFNEPNREQVLPYIQALAKALGANAEEVVRDSIALQYVVRAIPNRSPVG